MIERLKEIELCHRHLNSEIFLLLNFIKVKDENYNQIYFLSKIKEELSKNKVDSVLTIDDYKYIQNLNDSIIQLVVDTFENSNENSATKLDLMFGLKSDEKCVEDEFIKTFVNFIVFLREHANSDWLKSYIGSIK